jgi:hypothetical protein
MLKIEKKNFMIMKKAMVSWKKTKFKTLAKAYTGSRPIVLRNNKVLGISLSIRKGRKLLNTEKQESSGESKEKQEK